MNIKRGTYIGIGRYLALFGVLILAASVLAACGSSSSSSSSEAATTSGATTEQEGSTTVSEEAVAYTGKEKGLPAEYPEPEVKSGEEFVVGFLSPTQSEPILVEIAEGAEKEAAKLGGKVIVKDAEAVVENQVSQYDELMAQGATSLLWTPLDPLGEQPQIQQAVKKNIPIIGIASPKFASSPAMPGFTSNVTKSDDEMTFFDAKAMSEAAPGGEYAILTLAGKPFEEYTVAIKEYAQKFGLKFAGITEVSAPTTEAAATAMQGIIAKNPNLGAMWVFSQGMAAGAASVAKASGADIFITTQNASKEGYEAVLAGSIGQSYKANGIAMGEQAVRAAYDAQTGQGAPLPKVISIPGTVVNEKNAEELLNESE